MEKRVINYLIIAFILIGLTGVIFFYRTGLTGNAINEINSTFINLTKEIKVSEDLNKGFDGISVKSMKQQGDAMNISYVFDNSNFIGNEVDVNIWIENSSQIEIKRVNDYFSINQEGLIERDVQIDLACLPQDNYSVYFSLGSNKPVKESVILGSSITGNTILDQPKNKWIGYVVFIFVILAGIFFIIRNHGVEEK